MSAVVLTFLRKSQDGQLSMSQFACELCRSTSKEVGQVPCTLLFRREKFTFEASFS